MKKIKTIDSILIYEFTEDEKILLKNFNIINGCWWSKWFKFKYIFSIIKFILKLYWKTDLTKFEKLIKDFENFCSYVHDIDFTLWWGLKDFYEANINFIIWILKLLHWSNAFIRILITIVLYIWLNIIWLLHFEFRKKKLTLEELKNQLWKSINDLN